MIVSEVNNNKTTVRIHDDYCESNFDSNMEQASLVVSESYKRRCQDNALEDLSNGSL